MIVVACQVQGFRIIEFDLECKGKKVALLQQVSCSF
jgi:hypothetical protein